MRTFVIAESGGTHEGDLGALLALVDVAADAGCDAFKAQWMSDPEAVCQRRSAPEYLPHYQWLKFSAAWLMQLRGRCLKRGLQFGCTVYLPQDVAVIDPHVDFYKIASFEAECEDLLEAYARAMIVPGNTKRLLISLGLGASLEHADEIFDNEDTRHRIDPLRCVAAYPTSHADLHLSSIREQDLAGLSDHTPAAMPQSQLVGAIAVAAGATIIERHVRLESCKPSNPDYAVSMTVHELTNYVAAIREAEDMMGDGGAPMSVDEEVMTKFRAVEDGTVAPVDESDD